MIRSVRSAPSYRGPEERQVGNRIRIVLSAIVVFLVVYRLMTFFFVGSVQVETDAMAPELVSGDRAVVSRIAYGLPLPFTERTLFGSRPERGDVVIYTPNYARRPPALFRAADGIVRLLTFERISFAPLFGRAWEPAPVAGRIVAVPGDTVRMEEFRYRVQTPAGATVIDIDERDGSVRVLRPAAPAEDRVGLPLSGTLPARRLDENEYWISGDNRGGYIDSSYTGPVSGDAIVARLTFRFSPLPRFGGIR